MSLIFLGKPPRHGNCGHQDDVPVFPVLFRLSVYRTSVRQAARSTTPLISPASTNWAIDCLTMDSRVCLGLLWICRINSSLSGLPFFVIVQVCTPWCLTVAIPLFVFFSIIKRALHFTKSPFFPQMQHFRSFVKSARLTPKSAIFGHCILLQRELPLKFMSRRGPSVKAALWLLCATHQGRNPLQFS